LGLKLIPQARATTLMTSFARGDRVGFHAPGGVHTWAVLEPAIGLSACRP